MKGTINHFFAPSAKGLVGAMGRAALVLLCVLSAAGAWAQSTSSNFTVDGNTYYRNAWFIAVANSRQYGYNLAVAPKAKLNDGLMDISILDKVPIDHLGITAPLAFTNHLDLSQHVEMFRAKDVLIEGNADRWVNLDGEGENIGTSVHFTMHPNSVKIYARDLKYPLREIAPNLGKIIIDPTQI